MTGRAALVAAVTLAVALGAPAGPALAAEAAPLGLEEVLSSVTRRYLAPEAWSPGVGS